MSAADYGQPYLSSEPSTAELIYPLKSEMAMSRILLISSFAALLAACSTQRADVIDSANQGAWTQYIMACAAVGIDPGSAVFSQCVADLHRSLWAEQNLYGS